MKKIFLTLLFLIPFLSGCASIDTNLTINKNKSAGLEVKMISNSDALPLELATMKDNISNFVDNSYKITDNSTSKSVNVIAIKEVKNLKDEDIDMSSLGFVSKLPSGRFVEIKHNFFVTSYNIHLVYNLSAKQKSVKLVKTIKKDVNNALDPEYLKYAETYSDNDISPARQDFIDNFDKNLLDTPADSTLSNTKEISVEDSNHKLFDISSLTPTFSVKLPYFASYNNADKVIGTVYTWNINKSAPTEIKLQYVVYSGFSISLMIIAGILLLIYLARRIHRHDTLKRIGNNN